MNIAHNLQQPHFDPVQLSANEVQALRQILERSQRTIDLLRAYSSETLSTSEKAYIQSLIYNLENQKDPQAWLSTPSMTQALSLLIRFDRLSELSPSDIRETVSELITASSPPAFGLRPWAYPLFLVCILFLFFLALSFFIIPIFGEMYLEFGLRVPSTTEFIVNFSRLTLAYPIPMIGLSAGILILIVGTVPATSYLFHRYQFVSLVGFWVTGSKKNINAMKHWLSTLAELLELGFQTSKALPIAAKASESVHLTKLSYALSDELRSLAEGRTTELNPAITKALPATVVLAILSPSNPSPSLLRQIAYAHRLRHQTRQERMGSLLAPITTILIGLFVGFIVLALFLPLVSLVTSLS